MVNFRKFLPEDFDKLIEIEKLSFKEPWPDDYFRKISQKYQEDLIVAEVSNKIVGYILRQTKEDGSGSIRLLAVDPGWRRQGIGKELINLVIDNFKKSGIDKVSLKVRKSNEAAERFYEKMEFKKIKIIKKYFANGEDAYLMRKDINNRSLSSL